MELKEKIKLIEPLVATQILNFSIPQNDFYKASNFLYYFEHYEQYLSTDNDTLKKYLKSKTEQSIKAKEETLLKELEQIKKVKESLSISKESVLFEKKKTLNSSL